MNCHTQTLDLPQDYSLRRSLRLLSMGSRDPSMNLGDYEASLCFHLPGGNVTINARQEADKLDVCLYGAGTEVVQPAIPDCFGLNDRPHEFTPDKRIARLFQQHPGIYLPRLPTIFHKLVQIVLQQLVSWDEAASAWRRMTMKFGEPAPGPDELVVGPAPDVLRSLGYYDLVACGALPKQARLIIRLAAEYQRIERLAASSPQRLTAYLEKIPGIGPWTIQYLLGTALGEADAILTGDYALPHTVSWVLLQKPRSDDKEMLQLLAPYAGHRFRVQHLLLQSGIMAPRRGPKMRRRPPGMF